MNLYIVANADGRVISSTNGTAWSVPFQTGIQIGKAAIANGIIVYTRSDATQSISPQTGLYYTSTWNSTPVLASGTEVACFNEVKYLNGRFVAVGFYNTSPKTPAFAHSPNGVDWTIGSIDPTYATELAQGTKDIKFNDVASNGVGYLFVGSIQDEDLAGAFYTTDIESQIGPENYVNPDTLPSDVNQIVYMDSDGFSGWSAFSDDRKTWFLTTSIDPLSGWDFFELGLGVTEDLKNDLGLDVTITDAASGISGDFSWWILGTSHGQVIVWPHEPTGPYFQVLNPYTAKVATIASLNPLTVTFSDNPINGELVTIAGSQGLLDLDGNYFVKSIGNNQYQLHSESNLTSPVNAISWVGVYVGESATATFSHGAKIDAVGYGDGSFFLGTDLEEVFKASNLSEENMMGTPIEWTKVDDQYDSFDYWNDVDFGYFGPEQQFSSSSSSEDSSSSSEDSSSSSEDSKESISSEDCLNCEKKIPCRKNQNCKCVQWNYTRGAWIPAITMCEINGQSIS